MKGKALMIFLAALIILPLVFFGCKSRAEKTQEAMNLEAMDAASQEMTGGTPITEPAQTIATETIPPTASPAPQVTGKAVTVMPEKTDRNRDIQRALKNAHLYAGAIDGKIGPKTKRAIEEFQSANGLKADGKVGPKTWVALEKYLKRLEEIERVVGGFEGVKQSYAVSAGREVRVFVVPEKIDDFGALNLAKKIAQKIQSDVQYPGEIKVTVIREVKAVEYAR